MRTFLLIAIFSTVLLSGCGKAELEQENAMLKERVDSVNLQLEYATGAINALTEVGIILDSIEAERNILNVEMVDDGLSEPEYADRINRLNDMLAAADELVGELQASNSQYERIIRQLRSDLAEKTKQVEFMELVLETMREENVGLKQAMRDQGDEMYVLEASIAEREEELKLLEEEIQAMQVEARHSEAEAFFRRAEVYEEVAARTKLASKKKKEALQNALFLYRKSQDLGYEDAKAKVKELEEALK